MYDNFKIMFVNDDGLIVGTPEPHKVRRSRGKDVFDKHKIRQRMAQLMFDELNVPEKVDNPLHRINKTLATVRLMQLKYKPKL